jgi:hypothetical protein
MTSEGDNFYTKIVTFSSNNFYLIEIVFVFK